MNEKLESNLQSYKKQFLFLFLISLVIAASALLFGLLALDPGVFGFKSGVYLGNLMRRATLASFVLTVIWIIFFVATVVIHKWRGLWLLVGMPFVGLFPLIITIMTYECAVHLKCP